AERGIELHARSLARLAAPCLWASGGRGRRGQVASDLEVAVRNFGRRVRSRAHGLVGRQEEATVLWARTLPGWFSRHEIRLLYRTVCGLEGPGDIAEVGSWKGRSTVVLGRAVRDAGLG